MCARNKLNSLEVAVLEETKNGHPVHLSTKSRALKAVCSGLEAKGCVKVVPTHEGPVWSLA